MKKSRKSVILIIMALIIFSIVLYIFLNNKDVEKETSKYSNKAIATMKQNNLYDELKDLEYNKTIEILLENDTFHNKYLEDYLNIKYNSKVNDFDTVINTFLDKSYSSDEINYILTHYNNTLDILLDMEYIDILAFKDISNFNIEKLERYINYKKDNDYDLETVVTYVNIGLDLPGYSEYTIYSIFEATNDLTILVNKYHKLSEDYEPDDLTLLSTPGYYLRKEAAEAYEKLKEAAAKDNVIIIPFSAYRSFDFQKKLYDNYKAADGEKNADTYSARPGFSEHQLGLAVDVRSNTLWDNLTDNDYKWMLNNSYKYGFIIRYPKGKQYITQYIEEPWHIRYLGTDLATKVHDSNLTYDEYYDLYMTNKNSQ